MTGTYTVTQINSYIKNMFRQDYVLNRVAVKGEISNCKYHTSGHIYFSLKDEQGVLAAVMFKSSAAGLKFRLENGMQVVVKGHVDVYERDGKYQLYATEIEQDGIGDLYKRYEELKRMYEEMGYFSAEYKRSIPKYARKIGIVTASTGAAIHDIMNISYRRNPYVSLILYPAYVQGVNAAESIVNGIRVLDEMGLDVIIVGRGGGSIEDLWAFNEQPVVEAIFNANTPIISAVGHETDFTIADFVSDMRAPTPSAAAELAVFDINLAQQKIDGYNAMLNDAFAGVIEKCYNRLDNYKIKLNFLNPINQINDKRQMLDVYSDKVTSRFKAIFNEKRHLISLYASRLEGVSPLKKLSQGYAYVESADGKQISDIGRIKKADELLIYLKDGKIKAQVKEVIDGN